jgi:hypothetical protein
VAGTRSHGRDLGCDGWISRILLLDDVQHRHVLTMTSPTAPATIVERRCALTAVALSDGRRAGVQLVSADKRLFGLSLASGQVHVPLINCAQSIRRADEVFHFEPPSTRVLVAAAQLIVAGVAEDAAARARILAPLSNDGAISEGLREMAAASLISNTEEG